MWLFLFVGFNTLTFILYGIDKGCAAFGMRRISEALLISLAFFMGGIGAIFGILLFRHKIRKPKFITLIFIALIINLVILAKAMHFLL